MYLRSLPSDIFTICMCQSEHGCGRCPLVFILADGEVAPLQTETAQIRWAVGCDDLARTGRRLQCDGTVLRLLDAMALTELLEVNAEHLWHLVGALCAITTNLLTIQLEEAQDLEYREWAEVVLAHLRERPSK